MMKTAEKSQRKRNMSNILHRVPESRITPEDFLAYIEIPAKSKNKYEYDEECHALVLDRVLYTATHYPHNYGFVPKTWGLDDDPLDVMVVTSEPVLPGSLIRCAPIGVLEMTDGGKSDEKIIAVCVNDPVYAGYEDIHQLPKHLFDEIRHFFTVYKQLEFGKVTEIEGFEGREKAIKVIKRAKDRYHTKFPEGEE